jgi:transposase
MAKKYVVDLTAEERASLQQLLQAGSNRARRLTRARILLLAADDAIDEEIVSALKVGRSTVERTRRRFVEGGVERALHDRPRPGKPRKLNGKQEAMLVALACSDPPEGWERWTMQLLAGRLVELKVVDAISDETVRLTLKKTPSNRGRRSSGASPR